MKTVKRMTLGILFLILVSSFAAAQSIPQATTPEEVGLSKERLERISEWLKTDVDKKVIPGAVAMVLRKGKIAYYEAFVIRIGKKIFQWPAIRSSVSIR